MIIPRKPTYCASCVEDHPDLRLGAGDNGRIVWLCPGCRTPVGQLRKYEGHELSGTPQVHWYFRKRGAV